MEFNERLAAYKHDGYTVFKNVFSDSLMEKWKDVYPSIVERQTPLGQKEPTLWLRSTLEFEPKLFLPAVAHPSLLNFAERVLGPFVQMDNLTFMAFPSVSKEDATNKASGWHRDIWAYKPTHGEYVPPLACNAITYLQDLTEEYGPLRVLPGSHRSSIAIDPEHSNRPHPEEIIVPVQAGDVVFTHSALYHSGTPNFSGKSRFFFSLYYNKSWLKCRDNHNGPAVQAILEQARSNEDRRLMRLFGEDPMLFARANNGFSRDDEIMWDEWIAEDRRALINATPIGLEDWL
ncbi:MAG: phytanoyl-CoA dioxygenase family protein [Candidatus Latescibacterota bacterium]|nr:phytanoyl-CoA dioxygenase family protein [Candidatus Latescibacterota bacterium]